MASPTRRLRTGTFTVVLVVAVLLSGACGGGAAHPTTPVRFELREVLKSSVTDRTAMATMPFSTGVIASGDPYRRTSGFAEGAPAPSGELVSFVDNDGDGRYRPDIDTKVLLGPARVSGTDVKSATAAQVPRSPSAPGGWVVEFALTGPGAGRLSAATSRLLGRQLAIVVDGIVVSAPVVQARISGGRGSIGGNLTERRAKALASELDPTS